MYQAASESMKNIDNSILVGGPGAVPTTTIGIQPEYREGFIDYCSTNNVPLDFYSWHIYGVENPYGIKAFADTIKTLLDVNGYTNAQSVISEINYELSGVLDTLTDSPYGAAYYLSTVLTMQDAPVDKLLWYPSACHVMSFNGDTMSSRSYYAMASMRLLQTITPIRVECLGSEVIEGSWDVDTTNMMVFAGKSVDNDKLYFLISNLNSENSIFDIDIANLPWSANDSIRIIKNEITYSERYTQTETMVVGGNSISITAENYSSPSVLFYRIEKASITNIEDVNANELVFANPVKDKLVFNTVPEDCSFVEVFSISGQKIISHKFQNNINVSNLDSGIYLLVLKNQKGNKILTRKFQKL